MNAIGTKSISSKAKFKKWDILYIPAVFFLSVMAIERIDFLQGEGFFKFTLELLSVVLFLVCFVIDVVLRRGSIVFSVRLVQYFKILSMFFLTVFISVLFSADIEMSLRRMIFLTANMFSGLLLVNYLITRQHEKFTSIVVACMIFQTIVYLIFCVYDILSWFNNPLIRTINNLFPFIDSDIRSNGNEYLRVRGANGDVNRAGVFLIVNMYLILQYCRNSILKITLSVINCLMVLLTRSRTAMLCMVLFLALYFLMYLKPKKKTFLRTIIVLLVILGITIGLYRVPSISDAVDQTMKRFQTRDASADGHIKLIQFGLKTALSNPKVLLVGNGYGASWTILEELQGRDNKYANFHDAFVSFLVECGLVSMVLFIALLLYPLMRRKSLFPIVAILILANIPYQIYNEPYFWFLLPFLCVAPSSSHTDQISQKESGGKIQL